MFLICSHRRVQAGPGSRRAQIPADPMAQLLFLQEEHQQPLKPLPTHPAPSIPHPSLLIPLLPGFICSSSPSLRVFPPGSIPASQSSWEARGARLCPGSSDIRFRDSPSVAHPGTAGNATEGEGESRNSLFLHFAPPGSHPRGFSALQDLRPPFRRNVVPSLTEGNN